MACWVKSVDVLGPGHQAQMPLIPPRGPPEDPCWEPPDPPCTKHGPQGLAEDDEPRQGPPEPPDQQHGGGHPPAGPHPPLKRRRAGDGGIVTLDDSCVTPPRVCILGFGGILGGIIAQMSYYWSLCGKLSVSWVPSVW